MVISFTGTFSASQSDFLKTNRRDVYTKLEIMLLINVSISMHGACCD